MTKDEVIKLAAEAGTNAAIKFIKKEYERRSHFRFDKRLRNTKLLLSHYVMLEEHSKRSISNVRQLETNEEAFDVLDSIDDLDNETYIQSIKRSATRTRIILAHIQEMVAIYEIYCERSGRTEDPRRCRVLKAKFFQSMSNADIAATESVDERTIRRDLTEACQKLSALIFGIDGLTSDVHNVSFTQPFEL
ncbi:MAG: hypothetical protein VB133_07580 [Anaeromusa sp.]|uniref:hypothetical protein n=1 Tax=Anaeromusa sp. TaxID=1872520 RepID=UPI002B1EDD3C|nr:hypothetical protein [Anaeromusa sp.]MEA4834977.1 hypothetical protein [Anaeromusa sp.]